MKYQIIIQNFALSAGGQYSTNRTGQLTLNDELVDEGYIGGQSYELDLKDGDVVGFKKFFNGHLDINKVFIPSINDVEKRHEFKSY